MIRVSYQERYDFAGFECGGKVHDPRNEGKPLETGKGQEMDSPLELPKRTSPPDNLTTSPPVKCMYSSNYRTVR